MQARRRGGVEVWKCAASVQMWTSLSQEIWSSGGMLRVWRRRDTGDLELGRRMLPPRGRGGIEVWKCAAGVASKEIGSSGDVLHV